MLLSHNDERSFFESILLQKIYAKNLIVRYFIKKLKNIDIKKIEIQIYLDLTD